MARIGRSVRVTGLVQGVFFRAWTREQAERLGVSGWVRNCSDGAVEAHLAGEEAAVEQMTDLLHQGPPHARVDRLDVDNALPDELHGFQIRH